MIRRKSNKPEKMGKLGKFQCGMTGQMNDYGRPCGRCVKKKGDLCATHREGAERGGPNVRFTDVDVERVQKILIECGGRKTRAAEELGCHAITVMRFVEKHEVLQEAIKIGQEDMFDTAEAGMMELVLQGDSRMIEFCLRRSPRWSKIIPKIEEGSGISLAELSIELQAAIVQEVEARRQRVLGPDSFPKMLEEKHGERYSEVD